MKTAILLSLLTVSAVADDITVETTRTPAEANRQQQQKIDAERRRALEEKPITYSGFLVDLSRAEKKSRFLSLRQARDPKNDYKNFLLNERTARPKGFLLFSLDFL